MTTSKIKTLPPWRNTVPDWVHGQSAAAGINP